MKEIHVHEDYNPKDLTGDIAIVQLNQTLLLTENILPICLPRSYNHDSLITVSGNIGEVRTTFWKCVHFH